MNTETILRVFEQELARQRREPLSLIQASILRFFLESEFEQLSIPSLRYIASQINRSYSYTRDCASSLYSVIRSAFAVEEVSGQNCGRIVRQRCARIASLENHRLLGRGEELRELLKAIISDRRRLVCITGPPRIGKSYLAQYLEETLINEGHFRIAVWCPANNLQTIEDLYQSIVEQLGLDVKQPTVSTIASLTHLLSTSNCLVIVEKTDTLFSSEDASGRFQQVSQGYEEWLQSILDRAKLNSCVVLVCRQSPKCLQVSHDIFLELPLRGLNDEDAELLLTKERLECSESEKLRQLINFCGHNPGVLAAAAYKIQRLGTGRLDTFLDYPLMHEHADDDLWHQSLESLTENEKEVIGWLLLHPDERVMQRGNEVVVEGKDLLSVSVAIQSLRRRALVDVVDGTTYCFASEWLRHVAARYISKKLAIALHERDIEVLNQYPLIVPNAPLWRRQWLYQRVLEPIGKVWKKLDAAAWRETHRCEAINQMLDCIRAEESFNKGFAAGNLINIAVAMHISLSVLNVSNLTIRHADLSIAAAQSVNLNGCHLQTTALPISLYGELTAALSPNGETFAIGDKDGRLVCWRRRQDSYEIYRFSHFQTDAGKGIAITALTFGDDETLAIAAHQEVYRWWLGEENVRPRRLIGVSSAITSLTCCSEDYIAVGMKNGSIVIYNRTTSLSTELRQHAGSVIELVADPTPDSWRLISRGSGDRVIIWRNIGAMQPVFEQIFCEDYVFIREIWVNEEPLFAVLAGSRPYLQTYERQRTVLPLTQGVNRLRFSHNSAWIAALGREFVQIKKRNDLALETVIFHQGSIDDMALSNDGRWLLTQKRSASPHMVQVWDAAVGKTCFEIESKPLRRQEGLDDTQIQCQGCKGFTNAERDWLRSCGARL